MILAYNECFLNSDKVNNNIKKIILLKLINIRFFIRLYMLFIILRYYIGNFKTSVDFNSEITIFHLNIETNDFSSLNLFDILNNIENLT